MYFLNKYQNATHNAIGIIIMLADLVVLIGIPIYTFTNGYGFMTAVISFFIALFIVSPIVSFALSMIGAIIMTTWTSITERRYREN